MTESKTDERLREALEFTNFRSNQKFESVDPFIDTIIYLSNYICDLE